MDTAWLLNKVSKPARYTGGEWNAVRKDHRAVYLKVALAFPDVYEVGMSHLGFKILYHILNKRPDAVAERVYAPWVDMEGEMRSSRVPLATLESGTPLKSFDVVGFTLQYELSYTNILNMLDLAGIPFAVAEREDHHPFIIGGGPCAFNPEPLAAFFDFFVLGEAEEVINEIADCLIAWKRAGRPGGRQELLSRMAAIAGVYVPSLYRAEYHADGRLAAIRPEQGAPPVVYKRVVRDLETVPYPTRPVVPYLEIVHDRIMLELFRGCTRGCRFCQAGMIYRPVRERSLATLKRLAQELVDQTGYSEISLTSLSSGDYSCLKDLVTSLVDTFKPQGVGVSLPSLRIDSFSVKLAEEVQRVRKTGLTFAPEAGTQRLRDVINKGVTEANLEEAVAAAFAAGWSSIKLYFMIGLPTETDADVRGIADLAYKALDIYQRVRHKRDSRVTVSVSSFVPKPHTAFQWEPQDTIAELSRKQQLLAGCLKDRRISFHWHDPETSFLEAVFARGDRKLGAVLHRAWELGCRFDGWTEHFKFAAWRKAFYDTGVDPAFYANRWREEDELLPWDHIGTGVTKSFLARERRAALAGELSPDCRRGRCGACGVCGGLGVDVIDWGER